MDELKLKLSTKLMRGIVAKLISKAVSAKFGYNVGIQINAVQVETKDGKVCLHADVDAEVNNDELVRIIKSIGLD